MIADTAAATRPRSGRALSLRRLARTYAVEAWCELLKVVRIPAYTLPTLAFPALFYVMFAVALGPGATGGFELDTYLLATYGTFGVVGAALFGFGVGVAIERGQGWLLLKRASPMPPGAYFAAKVFMALVFSVLIVATLFALGAGLAGVRLAPATWLALGAILVSGALPFCAFGLVFGVWCGPNSAPAVVNLVYLPMAFASGLWIPIPALPSFLQGFAPWLPPFHLSQLALKPLGLDLGRPVAYHVAALLAVTAFCLLLAWFGYRRDEGKTYG